MYSRCASAGYDPICAGCESLPRSFACKALTRRQPRSSRLASPSATELARQNMIDNLSFFVSHGLLLLAAWRLIFRDDIRSEEHTSELQSLMHISYAVFRWTKKQ